MEEPKAEVLERGSGQESEEAPLSSLQRRSCPLEASSAQILGLRLIGFLHSHSNSDVEEAFIDSIRREDLAKIGSTCGSLVPASDCQAFEQAKRLRNAFLAQQEILIDIEKIMKSKQFDALLKKSKENAENQIMEMEAKRSGEQLVHPVHLSHHIAITILPIGYMVGDHKTWHVMAAMVILFLLLNQNGNIVGNMASRIAGESDGALDDFTKICLKMLCGPDGELPEKLKILEPHLIEHGSNEIMH